MKPETALKAAIIDALRALGCEVWNSPSGKVPAKRGFIHMAPKGTPDIIGYLPDARILGVEVKIPKGRTDPERARLQAAWRERCNKAGGVAFEAYSVQQAVDAAREAMEGRAA